MAGKSDSKAKPKHEDEDETDRDFSRREFLRVGGIASLAKIIGTPPLDLNTRPEDKPPVKKRKLRTKKRK